MQAVPFVKMHGLGNDYVFFDFMKGAVELEPATLRKLADRHYGIGADGIVLLLPSKTADAKMRMYNPDGTESKMCGNAIRCAAKYVYDAGIARRTPIKIETLSGVKHCVVIIQNGKVAAVAVDMGRAVLKPQEIPVMLYGESVVSRKVNIAGQDYHITCVSMGNPHAVVFCDDVDHYPVAQIGPLIENDAHFPERTNTEFVQVVDRYHLKLRVWERGAGETLACGTGACAAAAAAVLNGHCDKNTDIRVNLRGGELHVKYTDEAVIMNGGCEKVFEGTVEI